MRESDVELAALGCLQSLKYILRTGTDSVPRSWDKTPSAGG